MSDGISNKTLAILVVAAVLVSLGGTMTVLNNLPVTGYLTGSTTGTGDVDVTVPPEGGVDADGSDDCVLDPDETCESGSGSGGTAGIYISNPGSSEVAASVTATSFGTLSAAFGAAFDTTEGAFMVSVADGSSAGTSDWTQTDANSQSGFKNVPLDSDSKNFGDTTGIIVEDIPIGNAGDDVVRLVFGVNLDSGAPAGTATQTINVNGYIDSSTTDQGRTYLNVDATCGGGTGTFIAEGTFLPVGLGENGERQSDRPATLGDVCELDAGETVTFTAADLGTAGCTAADSIFAVLVTNDADNLGYGTNAVADNYVDIEMPTGTTVIDNTWAPQENIVLDTIPTRGNGVFEVPVTGILQANDIAYDGASTVTVKSESLAPYASEGKVWVSGILCQTTSDTTGA